MGEKYRCMVLPQPGAPLALERRRVPRPGPGQVLVRVAVCGVCRTDLHIADGELPQASYPVVPGHQIVGTVAARGEGLSGPPLGTRVGIPWLGSTCGHCRYCAADKENLCDNAVFTGCSVDGGFAEYAVADAQFCFSLPEGYPDQQVAPLLCAGLIGYRSLRMAGDDAKVLGFYGFGAAAHILVQLATHRGQRVYAFTRPGDEQGQRFARELGAVWAGGSDELPPAELDGAIIFAPVGELVVSALRAVRKAGVVVCAGIHMSDIPSFPYRLLWEERVVRSVANLTRADGEELLELAPRAGVRTRVQAFELEQANEALGALREGRVHGSAVLVCDGGAAA